MKKKRKKRKKGKSGTTEGAENNPRLPPFRLSIPSRNEEERRPGSVAAPVTRGARPLPRTGTAAGTGGKVWTQVVGREDAGLVIEPGHSRSPRGFPLPKLEGREHNGLKDSRTKIAKRRRRPLRTAAVTITCAGGE